MSQFFTLPIERVRENFVKVRFTEGDNFGTPDIEDWLQREAKAERPDVTSWHRLFRRRVVYRGGEIEEVARILEAGGYHYRDCPTDFFESLSDHSHRKHLEPLMKILHRPDQYGGSSVYLNMTEHPVVVIRDCGRLAVYDLLETYVALMPEVTYGSLLLRWDVSPGENRERMLRVRNARAELVHFANVGIRRVRQLAETDFERAVAVAEDGSEIVHADYVYAWSGDGRWPISIDKTYCRETKIRLEPSKYTRLPEERGRTPRPTRDMLVSEYVRSFVARGDTTEQGFFRMDGHGVFLTHSSRLPDPIRTLYRL